MARVGGALKGSFFFSSVPPFGIIIGPINYNYNMRPFEMGGNYILGNEMDQSRYVLEGS